jgi:hypothetical protein
VPQVLAFISPTIVPAWRRGLEVFHEQSVGTTLSGDTIPNLGEGSILSSMRAGEGSY